MDFLKSAFSGGREEEEVAAGTQGDCPRGGGFGGLVKTLASRSESAIQTCRRDLGEFGTGFLKETAALRAAIRDLPTSLIAGAAAAPESPASADRAADGSGGQAGDARASLIGRVLASRDEGEEVLSWDVEEEDEDDDDHHHHEEATKEEQRGRRKHRADSSGDGQGQAEGEEEAIAGGKPVEGCSQKLGKVASSPTPEDHESSGTKWEKNDDVTREEQVVPSKPRGDGILLRGSAAEGAAATGRGIGDADTSSRPPVPEGDDVGWVGIEDLGDDDDDDDGTEVGASGGTRDPRRIDLRGRLGLAEEDDEDISWDFEDDEPIDP